MNVRYLRFVFLALAATLTNGVHGSEKANSQAGMLSRLKVGQFVKLEQAISGGYDVRILNDRYLESRESTTPRRFRRRIIDVGRDFIVVDSSRVIRQTISARAIDVITELPSSDDGSFAGVWRVDDSFDATIVVRGNRATATYPVWQGKIEGIITRATDGRKVLTGTWSTIAGNGPVTLALDESGNSFCGGWANDRPTTDFVNLKSGTWKGSRLRETPQSAETNQPPPDDLPNDHWL